VRHLFPGGGLCVVEPRFEPALQDKGNAQGPDNCPGRKAGKLQEDEGITMVKEILENLFPRHLLDKFREKALEEAIEEENREFVRGIELER
jgi:hypothetical protein